MAEALSVLSLVGEGFAVGKQIGSLIRAIRNAPDELLALANEVADFNLVLNEVINLDPQSADTAGPANSSLGVILRRAESQLGQLDQMVKDFLRRQNSRRSRLRFVKEKSRLQSSLADLQETRESLMVLLALKSVHATDRIDLSIHEVKIVGLEIAESQHRSADLVSSQLASQRKQMDHIVRELTNLQQVQSAEVEQLRSISELSGMYRGPQRAHDHYVHRGSMPTTLPDQPGMELVSRRVDTAVSADSAATLIGKLSDLCSDPAIAGVSVIASPSSMSSCVRSCSCSCHKTARYKTPSLLNVILGSLFLGYSGTPGHPCNEQLCKRQANSKLELTYYFPRWFILRRMVMLRLTTSNLGDPIASLKVCRVVPFDAEILSAATFGDTATMMSLLEQRLASPFDVSLEGDSALIWAVEHDQKDVCKLLLQAGASVDAENMDGYTAVDVAWTKILGKTSKDEEFFRNNFAVVDGFENRQYTTIHKIVLELIDRDLQAELEVSTALVNVPDAKGRTPLSWAVQRGDYENARMLLEYGADPNAFDTTGRSLFRWAVYAANPSCTELLIEYGADVNHKDCYGNTPLHYACWFQPEAAHATALVKANADVNARSFEGNKPSPFHLACWHGHDDTAAMLIKSGAILGAEDTINILFLSIEENLTQTRRLMPTHFDCSVSDMHGNTILHAAAYLGMNDLQKLRAMRIVGLLPEAQNVDGYRPADLLEMRYDAPADFKSAFQDYLDDISDNLPEQTSSWHSAFSHIED